ncbi:MAG: hypothetical protein DRP78_06650 [Candidatus Omnitrophota bacterium]|nr:MAG: hypothetical protein DRP78_06650 [Candidatus Omnitrophota bacterium]
MTEFIAPKAGKLKQLSNDPVLRKVALVSLELGVNVYLIGGTLRDLFVKTRRNKRIEFDFAVENNTFQLAETVARELCAYSFVLNQVKAVIRIVCRDNDLSYECDFAGFRACSLKEDIYLRDFTINTLCVNVRDLISKQNFESSLLDYFGAVTDIKKRLVRVTCETNFFDDPLRMLRGFRFCADLDFVLESNTFLLIKENFWRLRLAASERVCAELVKILTNPDCFRCIVEMDNSGILSCILPEIDLLRNVSQGKYHHLDIWQHSLDALLKLEYLITNLAQNIPDQYAKRVNAYLNEEIVYGRPRIWILKLAVILHDIGKPAVKFEINGAVHFYTHEKVGANIAQSIGKRLKLSIKEIIVLKSVVLYHLRAGQIVNRKPGKRAKFRFFRDTKENALLVLLLSLADRRAMLGPAAMDESYVFLEQEIFVMIVEFFNLQDKPEAMARLINGTDVMNFLNIQPGVIVGTILSQVAEAQALGQVSTKAEAKKLVLALYTQK